MHYLYCDKCSKYYVLQSGESLEDFDDTCECGGNLKWGEIADKDKEIKKQSIISRKNLTDFFSSLGFFGSLAIGISVGLFITLMPFEEYLSILMVFIISGFVTSALISKESHIPSILIPGRLKSNFKLSRAYNGAIAAIVINIIFQSYFMVYLIINNPSPAHNFYYVSQGWFYFYPDFPYTSPVTLTLIVSASIREIIGWSVFALILGFIGGLVGSFVDISNALKKDSSEGKDTTTTRKTLR